MALSREWWEYHLTPTGWVEGTEKLDFSRTDRPAPPDRVATFIYKEVIPHVHKGVRTWTLAWKKEGVDLENLYKKYGKMPKGIVVDN